MFTSKKVRTALFAIVLLLIMISMYFFYQSPERHIMSTVALLMQVMKRQKYYGLSAKN